MIASHLICVIKQLFYDKKSCLREKNDISEKWDLRPETFGETQDPRPEIHPVGETQDLRLTNLKVGPGEPRPGTQLKGGTWDPRFGILKVGPETRDTYFTWDLRLETQDTERGIWDTYDR